jgi:hypothetical protein
VSEQQAAGSEPAAAWGRVDDTGTVYVRTSAGERAVGQWPGGDPAETLSFFARRFENLSVEVELLERRVRDRRVPPPAATDAVAKLRAQVRGAQAVGDLDALLDRLVALEALVAVQREERKAERQARIEQAHARKQEIVTEAQQLAAGKAWRTGADRLGELLEEWKSLDRLDKDTDTALWRAFSTARTAYSAGRRQHFAELAERRKAAEQVKLGLVEEAEALAESTDWGSTARRFRELMARWKAAGSAARGVEDRLWGSFRAAQDRFFTARNEATAAQDSELAANAERKDALLVEAEALLPVGDPRAARTAFRELARRWDEVGNVPRAAAETYENRFRQVEKAVLGAADERWQRSNPEGLARAEAIVAQLESAIAGLEADLNVAQDSGDQRRITEAREALHARKSWLEQAMRARDDFSAG